MLWEFGLNTLLAFLLGAVIGMEREIRRHVAGLKTNALVAVGAAHYVGLSLIIEGESSPTRIAAQVVSGLGFLGGGVILRDGFNVHGLNTAAMVWWSGAIGSLAGAGFAWEAILVLKGVASSPHGPTHVLMSADLFATVRVDSVLKTIVADLLANPAVASASWRIP